MSIEACSERYRLDPHARFRVLDDEGIFVLQEAGEVLVVNAVGAFIVEQLREGRSFSDAVMAVTQRYAVGEAQARADADALLKALLEAGAITRA